MTVIGLMFTLASLVGTFFYVSLSQWVRDLAALETRLLINNKNGARLGGDEQKALRDVKVELARHGSWINRVVNPMVVAFVVGVLCNALAMLREFRTEPLHAYVWWAVIVFIVFFVVLASALLLSGRATADRIAAVIVERDRKGEL